MNIGSASSGQTNIDYNMQTYIAKIAVLQASKSMIDAATSKIADQIVHAATFWSGPAYIAVKVAYELLKERLQKLSAAIQNNIDALSKVMQQMIVTEHTNEASGKTIHQAVQSLSIS